MSVAYDLRKAYQNQRGLDLKSTDLVRPEVFASDMLNAQYRDDGSIESRKGFQLHADHLDTDSNQIAGFGAFDYERIEPFDYTPVGGSAISAGDRDFQAVTVGKNLHKLKTATFNIAYTGSEGAVFASFFYDITESQYRFQITELTDGEIVADVLVDVGFEQPTPTTIDQLRSAIIADLTAAGVAGDYTVGAISGDSSTPAPFIKIFRDQDLVDLGTDGVDLNSQYWEKVKASGSSDIFSVGYTKRNTDDFENISAVQIKNVLYLSNGYDHVQKFDGSYLYRVGLPEPNQDDVTLTATTGGSLTSAKFYSYNIQYFMVDNAGNSYGSNAFAIQSVVQLGGGDNAVDVEFPYLETTNNPGFNDRKLTVKTTLAGTTKVEVDGSADAIDKWNIGDKIWMKDHNTGNFVEAIITNIEIDTDSSGSPAADTDTITIASIVDEFGTSLATIDTDSTATAFEKAISNNVRVLIYRSTAADSADEARGLLHYKVAELTNESDSLTATYTDTLSDSDLLNREEFVDPIVDRSLPKKGKYLTSFRNQLIISGNLENANDVFFSDVESPEYHPILNFFPVESVDGDRVTGIAPNNNVLCVFKDKSIHIVSGDLANLNIRVELLISDIGCAAHATIREVRGALYFLSDQGPYFMVGGQLPVPVGDDRVKPIFTEPETDEDLKLRLKRAVAINHRRDEQYILFLPAESDNSSGDRYSNANSVVLVHDYHRDAWLKWDTYDFSGGAFVFDNDLYWIQRANKTGGTALNTYLYRQMNINDAYDYQDNLNAINWQYSGNWEAWGEPSVYKRFLRIRVFNLESIANVEALLNIKTEVDYIKSATKADFEINISGSGYGQSEYGSAAYGDPSVFATRRKLQPGKYRSLRVVFENNQEQVNPIITGWELEIAPSYKAQFKR